MFNFKVTVKHVDTDKNNKIRVMAWITNTVEDDKDKLEEMFWPTKAERKEFNRKNREALAW